MHRFASLRQISIVVVACCVAVGSASCGETVNAPTVTSSAASDGAAGTTTSDAATIAPAVTSAGSSAATAEAVTSTNPATTVASTTSTTTATTATTATTTTPAEAEAPSGWTMVDADSVSVKAFPPCCGDTWHGAASPPPAPTGQMPDDGPYPVAMTWPADPTEPLELEVGRFEPCSALPESSCETPGPADYGPDDLGVDFQESRPMVVPLDTEVRATVVGWDSEGRFVVEQATGIELGALAVEVDREYADVFASRYRAGEEPSAIVADVIEHPTGGFGPGSGSIDAVSFTPTSGPPLLFQQVFPYVDGQQVVGRGVDVLRAHSIEVVDGRITLFVYAAYIP